jgi:hypothetical protein
MQTDEARRAARDAEAAELAKLIKTDPDSIEVKRRRFAVTTYSSPADPASSDLAGRTADFIDTIDPNRTSCGVTYCSHARHAPSHQCQAPQFRY